MLGLSLKSAKNADMRLILFLRLMGKFNNTPSCCCKLMGLRDAIIIVSSFKNNRSSGGLIRRIVGKFVTDLCCRWRMFSVTNASAFIAMAQSKNLLSSGSVLNKCHGNIFSALIVLVAYCSTCKAIWIVSGFPCLTNTSSYSKRISVLTPNRNSACKKAFQIHAYSLFRPNAWSSTLVSSTITKRDRLATGHYLAFFLLLRLIFGHHLRG